MILIFLSFAFIHFIFFYYNCNIISFFLNYLASNIEFHMGKLAY